MTETNTNYPKQLKIGASATNEDVLFSKDGLYLTYMLYCSLLYVCSMLTYAT